MQQREKRLPLQESQHAPPKDVAPQDRNEEPVMEISVEEPSDVADVSQ
jgi:hypothetical protein